MMNNSRASQVVTVRFNKESVLNKFNSSITYDEDEAVHCVNKTCDDPKSSGSSTTPVLSSDHTYTMCSDTLTAGMTTCSICGVWVSKVRLEQHMERQHKQRYSIRKFQCKQCGKLSQNKEALVKHIVKYHDAHEKTQPVQLSERLIKNSIICRIELEEKSIETGNSSSSHHFKEEEVKIKRRVKCDKCGIYLDNQSKLEWHIERVHCKTSFFCPKCKAYFPRHHLKRIHPELLDTYFHECKLCDKQFLKDYDKHKHLELEHSCTICKTIFSTSRGIEAHMREIHKESSKFLNSPSKKLKLPEAKSVTAKAALKKCVAAGEKLCGKCGSSYVKLRLHKQLCPGLDSFVTNSAGIECGRR